MSRSEIKFRFLGLPFQVCSDELTDLSWLKDFFEGTMDFGNLEFTSGECCNLSLSRNPVATREARRLAQTANQTVAAFILDSEVEYLSAWSRDDGTLCAYSPFYDVLFSRQKDIGICDDSQPGKAGRKARGAMMRAIREQGMDHIWRCGDSILHGAGFVVGSRAVLIAGDKMSGKTSLLCAILSLLKDSAFLANDRVALTRCGSELWARAIPTIISLRKGSLDFVPGLKERAARLESYYNGEPLSQINQQDRFAMTTRQFVSIIETTVSQGAPVDSIVFPMIDPKQKTFSLRSLSRNESLEKVRNAIFGKNHLGVPSEFFACRESGVFPDKRALLARLDEATDGIRCYELLMGANFYEQPELARFLDLVVA